MGPGTRVAVALSGGSDSVALTFLLRALAEAREVRLVGLAHFNHQLRERAVDEAAFCRELAARLQLPIVVGAGDVRARAARERRSIEAAAHAARYEFLAQAALELGADCVALGHTRDDQAETVLLRLLRGAGPRGLAGMRPMRGLFVRPLLECRRRVLREYLDAMGQPYCHDPTNQDVQIPRNRVRAELMPVLQARFNPRVVETLANEAALAQDIWIWLDEQGRGLLDAACFRREEGDRWVLDAPTLRNAPAAVARVALLTALEQVAPGRTIGSRHVEAARGLVGSESGSLDLPGQRLQRIATRLVLSRRMPGTRSESEPRSSPNSFSYPLSIPGEVDVPEARCTVSAEAHPCADDVAALRSGGLSTKVALASCEALAVRNRRPGDRFRPLGLAGHKKLQDFFVDRKVPKNERDVVPIVVDDRDRIVWIAGYAVDEDFRVTAPAQAVIMLRLRRWGGLA